MSRYFLGIDGGQSSTTALIGDESGRVVGYGRGGPCNHVKGPEGREKFIRVIRDCVGQAMSGEELPVTVLCGGFSGGPADKQALLEEMFPLSRIVLTTDAPIALTGATSGEPGIIMIAGTGSIAFGRNVAGQSARAGGWGYVFGDEGSGFDLTRQALRAALREHEGWGPRTALTPMLLAETGAATAYELMHQFYKSDWTKPKAAQCSKLVDRAAMEGDAVALDILNAGAQQLAGYTAAVRGMLFNPGETVQVSWIGGVFRSEILLTRYCMLVELTDGNICAPPVYGPATGALIEAYHAAGLSPPLSNVPEFEK